MHLDKRPIPSVLGRIGEEICRRWLLFKGFEVLDTNYACKLGEIDIVAARDRTIVFVEVKTRTRRSLGSPAEAVTLSKQRRIKRVAVHYLSENRSRAESCRLRWFRFDVAAVTIDWQRRRAHLRWIRNAF